MINTFCNSQSKSYENLLKSIQKNLPEISTSKETFSQKIYGNSSKTIVFKSIVTNAKGKNKETELNFNFSDIDVNSARPITKGDVIKIQLIVNGNQKLIKGNQDNKKIYYTSKFDILAKDINNARILSDLIKEVIPISNKISEKSLALKGYANHLNYLVDNIKNVSLIKKEYHQIFSIIPGIIGSVKLEVTASSGSKSSTDVYSFNIATLDANSIKFKISGDKFLVSLATRRGLKTIKLTKEGVQKNYVNNLKIVASSIENGKNLITVLKELIPLGEKEFKKNIPSINSVEEGVNFLSSLIKKVEYKKENISQKMLSACITRFEKEHHTLKKSSKSNYIFSFLDLIPQNIDFKISGMEIKVVLDFGNKYVKVEKDGVVKNYVSRGDIAVSSVEHAIIISEILKKVIEKCNQTKKKTIVSSTIAGLEMLVKQVKNITLSNMQYDQNITHSKNSTGGYLLKLKYIETSSKKSKENIYEINLSDINHRSIELKISGDKVFLMFSTKFMEKIIKTYQNGISKNYTNTLNILCDSVENAREIKEILIELTKEN